MKGFVELAETAPETIKPHVRDTINLMLLVRIIAFCKTNLEVYDKAFIFKSFKGEFAMEKSVIVLILIKSDFMI